MYALPTKANIARRIPKFSMQCAICGAVEESDSHIRLHCPMAMEIWNHSGFDRNLWDNNFPSIMDCILFGWTLINLKILWRSCGSVGTQEIDLYLGIESILFTG